MQAKTMFGRMVFALAGASAGIVIGAAGALLLRHQPGGRDRNPNVITAEVEQEETAPIEEENNEVS